MLQVYKRKAVKNTERGKLNCCSVVVLLTFLIESYKHEYLLIYLCTCCCHSVYFNSVLSIWRHNFGWIWKMCSSRCVPVIYRMQILLTFCGLTAREEKRKKASQSFPYKAPLSFHPSPLSSSLFLTATLIPFSLPACLWWDWFCRLGGNTSCFDVTSSGFTVLHLW